MPVYSTDALEDMVINILGNSAPYEAMIEKAVQITQRASQRFGDEAKELASAGTRLTEQMRTPVEAYQNSLTKLDRMLQGGAISQQTHTRAVADAEKQFIKATEAIDNMGRSTVSLGQALSYAVTVFGAFKVAKDAFKELGEIQAGEIRLNATLEANGRNVQAVSRDYKDWAASMAGTTMLSQRQALALVTSAEQYGLTSDQAKKAARDAAALGAATGHSADSMIRLTQAMAQGDTELAKHFARMVPQLRGIANEMEFTARYSRMVEAGIKAGGQEAETAAGAWGKLGQEAERFAATLADIPGVARGLQDASFLTGMLGAVSSPDQESALERFVSRFAKSFGVMTIDELRAPIQGQSTGPQGPSQETIHKYDELKKKLEEQGDALRFGSMQAEINALAKKGLGDAELAELEALQRSIDMRKKETQHLKEQEDAAKRLFDATEALVQAKQHEAGISTGNERDAQLALNQNQRMLIVAAEFQKRMQEEAKDKTKELARVREEIMTPDEKFDAEVERLKKLRDSASENALSEEEYGKAVEKAREKIFGKAEAVKQLHAHMTTLQATVRGSAEDATRLAHYLDSIGRGPFLEPRGGKPAFPIRPGNKQGNAGAMAGERFVIDQRDDVEPFVPGRPNGPGAGQQFVLDPLVVEQEETNTLLGDIKTELANQNQNAVVIQLDPADFQ